MLLKYSRFRRLQTPEKICAEQLVEFRCIHRCTPISSRIVRNARTA